MNATWAITFDAQRSNKVEMQFYDMWSTTGENLSAAETLFETIHLALMSGNRSWENCVGCGLDDYNTKMGSRNSVKTRILK